MLARGLKFASIILILKSVFLEAAYYETCTTASAKVGKCVPRNSCFRKFTLDELSASQAACRDHRNEEDYVCCTDSIHLNLDGLKLLMEHENCGSIERTGQRIAYGEKCHPFEFRWMALLKYEGGRNVFRCAGSLISRRYVLTAAHCIPENRRKLVAVRLGEYDLSTEKDCLPAYRGEAPECLGPYEEIGIERYIVHENFTSPIQNDIALLRLARDVEFKAHIKPVCLPVNKDLFNNHPEHFDIAGWGLMENGLQSNVLRKFNAPVQRHNYCEQSLALKDLAPLTTAHICAGGSNFRDACKGDSGGGMVHLTLQYDKRDNRAVQYGIVSAGAARCGLTNDPGVYTNLLPHMQWITDHMYGAEIQPRNEIVSRIWSTSASGRPLPFTSSNLFRRITKVPGRKS